MEQIIRVHPAVQDIPLPGNYPCLTTQLNVTRYASQGLIRATLIVREPSEGIEVHRVVLDQREDTLEASGAVVDHVAQALATMRWLQLGRAI